MSNREELLKLAAECTDRTNDHIQLLDALIEDNQTPYELKVAFIKMLGTFKIQNRLANTLLDALLCYEDKIQSIADKANL